MKNATIALLSFALAALSAIPADAKGMLILQCGSDWCDSGEDVRRVFTSPEFRAAPGGKSTREIAEAVARAKNL